MCRPGVVGEQALQPRDERAADDRRAQDARALLGVAAQAVDREREDRREHDRVEQADGDDRDDGEVQPVVSTDVSTSSDAITACTASTLPGLNLRSVTLPMKRPTIAHSQ